MTKIRKYYGLIILDDGQFSFELGSYDKSDVTFERDDYRNKGYKLKNMQVITFDHCPSQGEIDQFISKLNSLIVNGPT